MCFLITKTQEWKGVDLKTYYLCRREDNVKDSEIGCAIVYKSRGEMTDVKGEISYVMFTVQNYKIFLICHQRLRKHTGLRCTETSLFVSVSVSFQPTICLYDNNMS